MSKSESAPEPSTILIPPAKKEVAEKKDLLVWLKSFVSKRDNGEDNLRDALEDYIEELSAPETDATPSSQERTLLTNILELRELTVADVMIPRADIVAIDLETSTMDLLALLSEKQYSRIPVYRETLDDVLGTIHIKDVLAALAQNKPIVIQELVREAMIVSPALPAINLILLMKESRKHLAFVIDEYGGIDGLVTIGNVVESILGDIQDEHEAEELPEFVENADGSYIVDARIHLHEFEEHLAMQFSEDEKEDTHTLGGLIIAIAARVPDRGEIIEHVETGITFEILDGNPRKVNRVRVLKKLVDAPGV